MDRYSDPSTRLIITYEGLTDDLIGPEVTKGLNDFLGQANGVNTIASESVACIWRAVVKNEPPPQQAAQIKKLQAAAVNQPQNPEQAAGAFAQQPPPQEAAAQKQPSGIQTVPVADPNAGKTPEQIEAEKQAWLAGQSGAAAVAPQPGQFQQQSQQLLQPPFAEQHYQQVYQPETAQQTPGVLQGGLRRRLDPGHHDSQRKGPDVPRPYTPEQLDSMMKMLLEVAERYKTADARLYHIMLGYYEKIREERIKLKPEDEVVKPPGGVW